VNAAHIIACDLVSETLRTFGSARLRVLGASMVPTLLPGDVLSVERAPLRDILPGEIAVFARDAYIVTHRVVARDGDSPAARLITRGDCARRADPPVRASDLLGRVVAVERNGRRVAPSARQARVHLLLARVLCFSARAAWLYVRLANLGRGSSSPQQKNSALIREGAEWPA